MSRKPIKIVHVNRHVLSSNRKRGEVEPPIVVRGKSRSVKAVYGHEALLVLDGQVIGRFVYSPAKPLDCGALVYFESDKLEIVPVVWDEKEKENVKSNVCTR
jgi:hypothetical protein